MKFLFAILTGAVCEPILTIPTRIKNGRIVTMEDFGTIDGQTIGPMLVNFNYPDIVVPICEEKRDRETRCYNPKTSDAFFYCDSVNEQCFDRMSPQLSCFRNIPASKWSLGTSTLTEHSIMDGGAVTSIHAFEFSSSIAGQSHVPMKGSISVQSGILGLAPARISCRNETFLSNIRASFMEIGNDRLSFFRDIPKAHNLTWTTPYYLVPVNTSSVQGKYAFNMINPSVCGADVLGLNVSAHWTTIIDAGEECLVVPQFMADSIHAWEGGDETLRFRVNHDSNDWISIPLNKVCVTVLPDSELEVNFESTGSHPIVLGSSVIAALSIAHPVGFETDYPYRIRLPVTSESPRVTCPIPRAVCKGQQIYFEPRNVCVDPLCETFFLSELDTDSYECVWRPAVPYIVYSLIIGYLIMEILAFRLEQRAVGIVSNACVRSTGLPPS